ncbi:MAG: hypothetical protein ABIR16_04415, partial [Dokdonella sp.]
MKSTIVKVASLLILLVSAPSAFASTFKVGTDLNCTHSTIQAAVNAANANPGLDHIIIANNGNYTAQAVKIQQAQPLTISGGYATCATTQQSAVRTIVSGAGGSADSVFTVEPGSADVLFDTLFIRDGDDSSIHYGGGIDYTGSGALTLNNVSLTQNEAGYGGGLSARGTGPDATVLFLGETIISNNVATQDGGGVHLRDTITLYALEPRTAIWLNRATGMANSPPGTYHGYGGGMTALGSAKAYIGSTGYGIGVFRDNTARAGGGIAALESDGGGRVFLFTTDPTTPQKVSGNRATDAGGAFYADAETGFGSSGGSINLWDT